MQSNGLKGTAAQYTKLFKVARSCEYCVGLDCCRAVVSEDFIFLKETSILFLFILGHRHLIKERPKRTT